MHTKTATTKIINPFHQA